MKLYCSVTFLSLLCSLLLPTAPLYGQSTPVTPANDPAAEPTVKAIARVLPAVVNINTERIVRRTYRDPYQDYIDQFFGFSRPPRELRQTVSSLGSGFIIDPTGYIVTNEHVVNRAEDLKISVTTPDGKTYAARYIVGDADADLALLKIESATPLPYISLDDLSPNHLGQTVLVVGNPLGYGHSVARGILSATNRTIALGDMEFKDLLQTDAAINPGNSGGPIIDLAGRLIGVASAKMAYTPQGIPTQGIGFAIPASKVAEHVKNFKEIALAAEKNRGLHGESASRSEAYNRLGLTLQDLTLDLAEALGLDSPEGVLISDVEPGSPAAEAGLRRGSVIYRFGRYPVNSVDEAERLLKKAWRRGHIDIGVGVIQRRGGRIYHTVQIVGVRSR